MLAHYPRVTGRDPRQDSGLLYWQPFLTVVPRSGAGLRGTGRAFYGRMPSGRNSSGVTGERLDQVALLPGDAVFVTRDKPRIAVRP